MITYDKETDKSEAPFTYGFVKNNPMTGKSLYELWVNKYGEKEATLRMNEFKNKQKSIGETKSKAGLLKGLSFAGGTHTEAAKKKLSKERKGALNPMYGKTPYSIWVEKYGVEEAVRRAAVRAEKCRQTRIRNGNKQK